MIRIFIFLLVLCATQAACTSVATRDTQENAVVHVVLIWLKESGNTEHIQQVIDATNRLKQIPEIQELRVGTAITSDRKIVDDSFDVGLYMTFADKQAMQRYLAHPKHTEAVNNSLKPLAKKFLVYDFEESQ